MEAPILKPTPTPNVPQPPKNNKVQIIGINIGIYFLYFIIGLLLQSSNKNTGQLIIFAAYLAHALVLLILALVRALTKKPNAGTIAFTGLLILIIGFGGCTAAFTLGATQLY